MKKLSKNITFFATFLFICAKLFAYDFPTRNGSLTDYANIFSSSEETEIQEQITQINSDRNIEFVVLTLSDLYGTSIENYAHEAFNYYHISRSGVLILIVKGDREVRIEVGTNLDNKLTNSRCSEIIRQAIVPEFKQGDFASGVLKAIQSVNQTLSSSSSSINTSDSSNGNLWLIIPIIIILLVVSFIFRKRNRNSSYNNRYNNSYSNHYHSNTNSTSNKSGGGATGSW